jgi:hypothetical protein
MDDNRLAADHPVLLGAFLGRSGAFAAARRNDDNSSRYRLLSMHLQHKSLKYAEWMSVALSPCLDLFQHLPKKYQFGLDPLGKPQNYG